MLTYPEKTKLAELASVQSHRDGWRRFQAIKKEGGFIGDIAKPAGPRLKAYWASVTDPATGMTNLNDVAIIATPNAEQMIREGTILDLKSPTWLNYLRIPGLFTEHAKDFVALNAADVKKQGGADEAVSPDRGQPPPVAPSGGPAGYG